MMNNGLHWKTTAYILIALLIGLVMGFLGFQINNLLNPKTNINRIEIVQTDIKNNAKLKIDSVIILKLQNDISLVEKKNDGRFEVLTWSSVLVLTLLLVFITINFIVSSSKVREIVDIEIDKKTEEIKVKTKSFTDDFAEQKKELQVFFEDSQKEYEKLKDLVNLYEETFKSKNKK